MRGNSFGDRFVVTTFGESHGAALGVVIDGCPAGLALDLGAVQDALDRRRPGQSNLVSPRKEADTVEVLSGMHEGRTLGTPLTLIVRNVDADARPYALMRTLYRPSHADFTTEARFGVRDWRGGGRASARETVARVAAGAVAQQVLGDVEIVAWVHAVGGIVAPDGAYGRAEVERSLVRCPDAEASARMEALIRTVRAEGDTVGGIVRVRARGVPAGWGEPVFGKLDARIGAGMLSLPACKGVEVGSGFAGTRMRGSEHNDAFYNANLRGSPDLRTRTNHSGGIQGGISNGMPVEVAVAFKPVATLFRAQETVDIHGNAAQITPKGRHDPCVLPRAVPIVEAMMALVLVDAKLAR